MPIVFLFSISAFLAMYLISVVLKLTGGGEDVVVPTTALLFTTLFAVLLAVTTRTLLTSKRIVRYRPALASLARLWSGFAGLERRARSEIELEDVDSVRVDGPSVVLTISGGRPEVRLYDFGDAHEAGLFVAAIERILAKRGDAVGVSVSTAERELTDLPGETLNCPYCRGYLGLNEVHECESCHTGHHEECMAIHGGCAVYGCANSPRRRNRA